MISFFALLILKRCLVILEALMIILYSNYLFQIIGPFICSRSRFCQIFLIFAKYSNLSLF